MKENRPVFIVSTGRSGSKMLAKTLALHPQLFSVHEPRPHLNTEAYSQWKTKMNNRNSEILNSIKQKRGSLISQTYGNKLIYLESSHYCSHLIPYLVELYKGRFIYLYRDGRDFVRSGLERDWYKGESGFYFSTILKKNFFRFLRRKIKIDRSSWEDHRLGPPFKYTTRVEKISWLWVEINKVILENLHKYSPAYLSIKLEEFSSAELKKTLEFIDVPSSETLIHEMIKLSKKKPNSTKERKIAKFDRWNDEEKESFYKIASDMMQTLNYSLESYDK